MKSVIVTLFLFTLLNTAFSQDTLQHDNYLRLCLNLADSIGIEHRFNDGSVRTIYKFKLKKSYLGTYDYEYIYIAAYEASIYRNNPFKNVGAEYWWTMSDTKEYYLAIPIYKHGGNF